MVLQSATHDVISFLHREDWFWKGYLTGGTELARNLITEAPLDDFDIVVVVVNGKTWKMMMSTPREKDSWMTSLKELLGDRCSSEVPQTTKTVTLERTESAKRREIQSMPRWGNEPTEQIVRSYSTGSTGPMQRPSFRKHQPDFATVRDDAADVSNMSFLLYRHLLQYRRLAFNRKAFARL